jgi:hypothetical protein
MEGYPESLTPTCSKKSQTFSLGKKTVGFLSLRERE